MNEYGLNRTALKTYMNRVADLMAKLETDISSDGYVSDDTVLALTDLHLALADVATLKEFLNQDPKATMN